MVQLRGRKPTAPKPSAAMARPQHRKPLQTCRAKTITKAIRGKQSYGLTQAEQWLKDNQRPRNGRAAHTFGQRTNRGVRHRTLSSSKQFLIWS
jgi:hypothetical protein